MSWTLGWTLVVLGVVGLVGGWLAGTSTAAAASVVAGVAMLAVIARDAVSARS